MFYDNQTFEITRINFKKKDTKWFLRLVLSWFGNTDSLVEEIETVDQYLFLSMFKNTNEIV